MATATDFTAFLAAAASFRDAWVNYNPTDASSRTALVAASTGLGAAALTLVDGNPALGAMGLGASAASLTADVNAYNEAVVRGDGRAQTSQIFAIVSDVAAGGAGLAAGL